MFKTPRSGKDHGNAIFVTGIDHFLVPDGPARLYDHLNF
jgi:hypothetical protein